MVKKQKKTSKQKKHQNKNISSKQKFRKAKMFCFDKNFHFLSLKHLVNKEEVDKKSAYVIHEGPLIAPMLTLFV